MPEHGQWGDRNMDQVYTDEHGCKVLKRRQKIGGGDCLLKTQDSAKWKHEV